MESAGFYLDVLEDEGKGLADAAEGNETVPVPTCPGWDVTDLVCHLASFQMWITGIVADRAREPRRPTEARPPAGEPVVAWFRSVLHGLLAELRSTPPDTEVWTVTIDHHAGAWAARQAGETAIHRWDVDNALGQGEPIAHAADYLDELFGLLMPNLMPFLGVEPPPATMRLQDGPSSWTVAAPHGAAALGRDTTGHADVTVTGTSSDLLLAIYGRPAQVSIDGDAEAFKSWQQALQV